MAKPSGLPEWNSGGSNNVEPSGGRKTSGLTTSDTPTSAEFNWWMEKVYRWIKFWDDATNAVAEALTWAGIQTFSQDLVLAAADPGNEDPISNKVTRKSLVKAYARLTTDGVGGVSLVHGLNVDVSSPGSLAISGSQLEIDYATPFTAAPALSFGVSLKAAGFYHVSEDPLGAPATGCRIRVRDNSGANVDLTTTALTVSIIAVGPQ